MKLIECCINCERIFTGVEGDSYCSICWEKERSR